MYHLLFLTAIVSGGTVHIPDGPQGPPGAILKYDLLSNSESGINYPSDHIGAFVAQDWPPGVVNNEQQAYTPSAATQDPDTGEITKVNGGSLRGAWPAIWMLGTGNGHDWPRHGEIDIVEAVNGEPKIVMTVHSTNHNGGNGQHPSHSSFTANADLTEDPIIAGFEWNIRHEIGQIDLTWWMTWYDLGSQSWETHYTTKVLFEWDNSDYYDFFNSFNGEGFSLLINLAEGGTMPGTTDTFIDGKPQFMRISSAKVYGF